jgi:succinate-semialdehyde dehydrogenase/glutarate-semialdehyde dehydrogenase
MTSNPRIRKLSFTGSTPVGKRLMAQAADQVLKVSLELGGNAPFIVFEDADLHAAVEGAIASKFRNAGQTCVCANRFYAQANIYDEFVSRLSHAASALRVGAGTGPVQIGPLIDDKAVAKLERHIADAVENGGVVMTGGSRSPLGGTFFEPTVIAQATSDMLVAREETFGPLAAIIRFQEEAEVVRAANASEFGLAAYFYTNDTARVWRVGEALQCGMVGVNTGVISTATAPFGGWKQSGLGREGSRHGLQEYEELKFLALGGLAT